MDDYQIDETLLLRPVMDRDAAEIYALCMKNREHLAPWMPWIHQVVDVSVTRDWIALEKERKAEQTGGSWVLVLDKSIVGVVGILPIDYVNAKTSVGYWVDAAHQGRGLVTRGLNQLLDYLFNERLLHRVEIHCAEENKASRAVADRLGFTFEGLHRDAMAMGEGFAHAAVYGLLAEEFTI
jgi:ribosomal-protein-serine acetyltransferase